jgi:magnesium-transporting ATPase (P-type)
MAGIKVWVLTGDKVTTAINIGKSAGLIDGNTQYEVAEVSTPEDPLEKKLLKLKQLCDLRDEMNEDKKFKVGFVLKGDLLPTI